MAIAAAYTPRLAAPSQRVITNATTRPLMRSASRATASTELFLKTPLGSSIPPRCGGALLTRPSSLFRRPPARRANPLEGVRPGPDCPSTLGQRVWSLVYARSVRELRRERAWVLYRRPAVRRGGDGAGRRPVGGWWSGRRRSAGRSAPHAEPPRCRPIAGPTTRRPPCPRRRERAGYRPGRGPSSR